MENNEIVSREEVKKELINECVYEGCMYCVDHPIILVGICLSGLIMATCIMIDKKKSKGVC